MCLYSVFAYRGCQSFGISFLWCRYFLSSLVDTKAVKVYYIWALYVAKQSVFIYSVGKFCSNENDKTHSTKKSYFKKTISRLHQVKEELQNLWDMLIWVLKYLQYFSFKMCNNQTKTHTFIFFPEVASIFDKNICSICLSRYTDITTLKFIVSRILSKMWHFWM